MLKWLFSSLAEKGTQGNKQQLERALEGKLDTAGLLRVYLLYVIFPLWLLVGLLDYQQHRNSRIEDTAGTTESLIHMFMLMSAGAPVMMGLLLEINSMVLAIMSGAFVIHDVASIIDGYYAIPRRKFTGAEQHIHSYMEGLPFMAVSVAALLYWRQFVAIFGRGPERAKWDIRMKKPPLSPVYLAGITTAIGLFAGLPYAEELWRCYRAEKRRKAEGLPDVKLTA